MNRTSSTPTPAPLMLSVSGMRGMVGRSLTPAIVTRYAAAFGQWLQTAEGLAAPHVVIGRDSRLSGQMYECAAVAGLISVGCRVTRVGILSTPGVAIMIDQLGGDGGMVVTASHNPKPWNGMKALRRDGVAPPPEQVAEILRRFHENDVELAPVEALQPTSHDETGAEVHVRRVLEQVDVPAIRAAKLTAVVDSVHGAGGEEARLLLEELGVKLHQLYAEPTGEFPHLPEPLAENLTELCQSVPQQQAHIGFAQDTDADRLAVVDEQGAYIGEEYTLALCALHRLRQGQAVVANLSTSRMVDDVAANVGGRVVRTAVGEANVAAGMKAHGADLGGEGNGGIILAPVSQVRDSLVGMALLLEMLAKRQQPLSRIADELPRYAIVKDKVEMEAAAAEAVVAQMPVRLGERFPEAKADTQDGVRLDWDDRWVHVRPSNPEPILRVIAEAKERAQAQELVQQARTALGL